MQLSTAADVPMLVVSHNSRSERRISPSWTIQELQGRLEPITGIPSSSQRLSLKGPSPDQLISLENAAPDAQLGVWNLHSYTELHVRMGLKSFMSYANPSSCTST